MHGAEVKMYDEPPKSGANFCETGTCQQWENQAKGTNKSKGLKITTCVYK